MVALDKVGFGKSRIFPGSGERIAAQIATKSKNAGKRLAFQIVYLLLVVRNPLIIY
jgi:hypothetical protein